MFVDVLKDYFNVRNKDDAAEIELEIRKKCEQREAENEKQGGKKSYASESVISTIVSLLSSEFKAVNDLAESEKKLRIFTAMRDVFIAESQINPLVLVLEDIHWVDELSMELILFLMKELSEYRITFACIYRPVAEAPEIHPVQKLEEGFPTTAETFYAKISLNPLSSTYSNLLLTSLLAVEDLPSDMKQLILDKAGGNPLYLEEVIRSIIDDGAIEQQDGEWLAIKEVEDIRVSSTVQGVIMARLDRLEEEPKHVLQCASVIGFSFEYDLLSYLVTGRISSNLPQSSNENAYPNNGSDLLDNALQVTEPYAGVEAVDSFKQSRNKSLDKHLERLEAMGFIAREEDDKDVFRFRHVLTQDVAYSTILKRTCKKLHEMIGHYLEAVNSQHLDDFYEILAYHYSNSSDIETALAYLVKAGNKNKKSPTGSAKSALRYFHEALTTLDSSSLTDDDLALYRQEIYDGQGDAHTDLGKYEMALSNFETVLHLTEQTEDDLIKAKALRKIGNIKTQNNEWEAALEAYEKSLEIVRGLGDLTQMGNVYNDIGYGYFERSDLDEAMRYFQKVLDILEQSGDSSLIGDTINNLGMIASLRGSFDEAIQHYENCVAKFEEGDDWHGLAQVYQNLGIAYFRKGLLEKADEYYRKSLEISEKRGIYRLITYTSLNIAEMYLSWPDLARAKGFCDRAFEILGFLDDKWARAEGYKYYGKIYRLQRNFQAARAAFQTSLEASKECDHLPNMAEVHCEMGFMYKEAGELEEALAHFGKCKVIFEDLRIIEEVQKINGYISKIKSPQVELQGLQE